MTTAFLLLVFLFLMPLIACVTEAGTRQILIIILILVAVALAIVWLWWLLDKCCAPTKCELLRILYWVFSWAIAAVGVLVLFCPLPIPFAFITIYLFIQQLINREINSGGCVPGAPDIFSWPFGDEEG